MGRYFEQEVAYDFLVFSKASGDYEGLDYLIV
jgi:hypothetical protein